MNIAWAELWPAVAFLAAGLLLVVFFARRFKAGSSALLVSLLFAPLLIFLAASGRLVEFKGLGVEAKFQQKANEPVKPNAAKISPLASSGSDIRNSDVVRRAFAIGTEVVLVTARADSDVRHDQVLAVAEQIYPGLLDGKFEALVITDESDRPLGYFPRSYFLDLLRIEILQTVRGKRKEYETRRVYEQLEQTELWGIVAAPAVRAREEGQKQTITISASNAEALAEMLRTKLPILVVVGLDGKYAGIVRQNDIVASLVATLAGIAKAIDAVSK
jgi:CBS domain-containing protein